MVTSIAIFYKRNWGVASQLSEKTKVIYQHDLELWLTPNKIKEKTAEIESAWFNSKKSWFAPDRDVVVNTGPKPGFKINLFDSDSDRSASGGVRQH